jgi:flagellar basal-body rod modification protein FlgD
MAELTNVVVKSETGVDGNSYTTAISNDKLTNNDFLKLLLEEMKMQDPTKPMDTNKLMDSQLKMSQIQANDDMSKSLDALTKTNRASSLSSAVSFMGKTIEDGTIDKENGIINSYLVKTIESTNGEVFVNSLKQIGFHHDIGLVTTDDDGKETYEQLSYDKDGNILDKDGKDTDINVQISKNGSFSIVDNKYVFKDKDGEVITDEDTLNKYRISQMLPTYSSDSTRIAITKVTKVY